MNGDCIETEQTEIVGGRHLASCLRRTPRGGYGLMSRVQLEMSEGISNFSAFCELDWDIFLGV
jgi:hypothetical protein